MRHLLLFLLAGCVTLDSFVHGGIPCENVGPETCNDTKNVWDNVCVPCDEEYDWTKTYPWMDGTLAEGETIRNPTDVTRFTLDTTDRLGTLDGYFIPAHGGAAQYENTTILYNHGNYAGIEHYQPRIYMLHELGFNVIAWDYRGYGKSLPSSPPSPEQFMADAVQIRDFADTVAPDSEKIIPYAFSLGGIPTMEMAAERQNCAIILEAAFTSLGQIMANNTATGMPATFLSTGDYEGMEKMARYSGPVFAMIGTKDRKFTVASWEEILEEAKGPKDLWVLEGVDHGIASGGVPEAGFTEYGRKILSFLETHAPACIEAN